LGPIFKAQGWNEPPANLFPEKGRYMWRDVARVAADLGLPFHHPTLFPQNGVLASRIVHLAAARQGAWGPAFIHAVFHANFVEDRDISEPEVIAGLLEALGQDADDILAAAVTPEIRAGLRTTTEEAMKKGIFGAPTFFVGDEMFWGNDRMDQAIAWAKRI
jgi:2-hydroxychromene-2-carboxylate isomerase